MQVFRLSVILSPPERRNIMFVFDTLNVYIDVSVPLQLSFVVAITVCIANWRKR